MVDVQDVAELFLYGCPFVYCTDEIAKLASPVPFNSFGYARQLLGPDATFVSPNNDTLYVIAPLDVSGGPLLLHTPDTGDRYYVLQFVDAWSNNVAYVGRRATGTAAADWLLTPSGYAGEVPAGATVIEIPSDVAVIVGRVQVDGESDLKAVHAVQDQFTLTPNDTNDATLGIPVGDSVSGELEFWERFRVYLRRFPAPDADNHFVDLAASIGLMDEESPFVDPDPALAAVLAEGTASARDLLESLVSGGGGDPGAWTTSKSPNPTATSPPTGWPHQPAPSDQSSAYTNPGPASSKAPTRSPRSEGSTDGRRSAECPIGCNHSSAASFIL